MLKIIELLFKTKEEAEQVLKVAKEEVLDRYGEITLCLGVLFDFVMVFLTGGLWLIWIIIRFLRNNS